MIDTNGIHDIPEDEYHADPVVEPSLSSTLARILLERTPLHCWWACPRLNPNFRATESAVFDLGRAFHRAMLGKGATVEVIDADSYTTKAAREARDLARLAGRTPMLAHQAADLAVMVAAARSQLEGFGIVIDQAHRAELSAFARAELENVWVRCRVDYAPTDPNLPLYDLKTTEDASPAACIRSIATYGYAIQAAFYLDAWEAATGERRAFAFAFVEKSPPYAMSVVQLHDRLGDEADWMEVAREKVAIARGLWGHCLATGNWPGYPQQIAVVGAPRWYAQTWEDRKG